MMRINFSESEKLLIEKFKRARLFKMNGEKYKILCVGKPRPKNKKGEPKTDVFIRAKDRKGNILELKISYKKKNADFIANKITADIAEEIYGKQWESRVKSCIERIQDKFKDVKLILKKRKGRTEAGSFTLGWRFELLNKPSGKLSTEIKLDFNELMNIYAGTNLPENKRNSTVEGHEYKNSGIASHLLIMDIEEETTIDDIIANLYKISEYVKKQKNVYAAFKAVNYRMLNKTKEIEGGSRQLAVYVKWFVKNGKLFHELILDKPLSKKAKDVLKETKKALKDLGIKDVCDITDKKVDDPNIIYQ